MSGAQQLEVEIVNDEDAKNSAHYLYLSCDCTLVGEKLKVKRTEHTIIVGVKCPRCGKRAIGKMVGQDDFVRLVEW